MNCFDNIIGIKTGCSIIEGSSALYIENLGITCQEADSYINDDYENGQALIEDKIAFATTTVKKTITNNFSGAINTRQFLKSETLGHYQDNLQLQSLSAGNYGGINWSLNNTSSYLDGFFNSISLQVDHTGDIDVFVYNLITGKLIDTITIPCIAGEISTKIINKTYSSDRERLDLIFVYDTSAIQSYKCTYDYAGCGSCSGFRYSNYYVSSTPILIDQGVQKIRSNITSQSHTYGLSLNYTVQCNFESWLCNVSNLLAMPILYLAGEEIMNYAILSSNRNNSDSNIDYERNEKRRDFFSQKHLENMGATMNNLVLPKNDTCFICNEPVRSRVILP